MKFELRVFLSALFFCSAMCTANPSIASGWKIEYSYDGQNTKTGTGQQDYSAPWSPGPTQTPQTIVINNTIQAPIEGASMFTSAIGTVTIKLTWMRAPNDMNDKPSVKIFVKLIGVASWNGTYSMSSSQSGGQPQAIYTFTGTCSNGLGSATILSSSGMSQSGSCAGIKVIELKSPQDYDRDAPDPITATLSPISQRGTFSATGARGSLTGGVQLSLLASDIPWHAHPTNFRQVDQHVYSAGDAGAPSLWFKYQWDSTSESLNDLDQCRIGEWVSYDGNPSPPGIYQYNQGTYQDLPIDFGYYAAGENPYVINGAAQAHNNPERGTDQQQGSVGWVISGTQGYITDTHNFLPISTMYPGHDVRYSADQTYGFRCSQCMANDPPTYYQVLQRPGRNLSI